MSHAVKSVIVAVAALGAHAAFAVTNNVQANYGTVALPFTHSIGDTFTSDGTGNFIDQLGNAVSSTTISKPIVSAPGNADYNYYDDFEFTMPSSSGTLTSDAISVSFASVIGINNLQVRLYPLGSLTVNGAPGLVSAWSQVVTTGPTTVTISTFASPVSLTAGTTYTLEVRGDILPSGGSYGGALNITAVPEPASALLVLVGLGAVGLVSRRRA